MVSNNSAYQNPYRWVVLTTFILVAGVSQMLWLNFAPLISMLQTKFEISELTASSLILVYPLLYVFLSLHAGALTDRKGYRWTIGLGSIIMSFFACVRIYDSNFLVLLIGSTGIAVGQPYVVNGISKLVSDWFSEKQSAIATGLGTVGMFIGMALGLALTPTLVESVGLQMTMIVFAAITIASTIFFFVFAKEAGNSILEDPKKEDAVGWSNIKELLRNRDLVIVFAVAFLGLGYFNGLTTWLEAILKPNGINAIDAGLVGGMLIVGGILGAIIIPALSDFFKVRKPFLLFCVAVAIAITYPLCTGTSFNALLIWGGALGFFFLPSYALLLEVASELAGEKRIGLATGILMLTGNAGGVIVILAMDIVRGGHPSFFPAIILMVFLLVISLILVSLIGETFHLRKVAPARTN